MIGSAGSEHCSEERPALHLSATALDIHAASIVQMTSWQKPCWSWQAGQHIQKILLGLVLCVQATPLLRQLKGYFHKCCGILCSDWSEPKGMGPFSCHCLGNIFLTTCAHAIHMEIMTVFLKQDLSDMSLAHNMSLVVDVEGWALRRKIPIQNSCPEDLSNNCITTPHLCAGTSDSPTRAIIYRLWPQVWNGHAHLSL